MHITYLNLPPVPEYIETAILKLVNNPMQNFHDSSAFVAYTKSNYNIEASEEIIQAISSMEYNSEDSLGYPLNEAKDRFENLAEFDFLEVTDDIKQWVNDNIPYNVLHISIQSMYNGQTITPHIDEMRNYAYNYIIEDGGSPSTCFWKPRDEFSHLKSYPQTVFSYDRIELIQKIKIPNRSWHRLDTSTIHSVENLDPAKKRISLSLSML
jgi:hypothetical protein